MIKYFLTNYKSTIGKNIRYLMYKFTFDIHQWYGSSTFVFNKVDFVCNL